MEPIIIAVMATSIAMILATAVTVREVVASAKFTKKKARSIAPRELTDDELLLEINQRGYKVLPKSSTAQSVTSFYAFTENDMKRKASFDRLYESRYKIGEQQ